MPWILFNPRNMATFVSRRSKKMQKIIPQRVSKKLQKPEVNFFFDKLLNDEISRVAQNDQLIVNFIYEELINKGMDKLRSLAVKVRLLSNSWSRSGKVGKFLNFLSITYWSSKISIRSETCWSLFFIMTFSCIGEIFCQCVCVFWMQHEFHGNNLFRESFLSLFLLLTNLILWGYLFKVINQRQYINMNL